MRKLTLFTLTTIMMVLNQCTTEKFRTEKFTDKNGYQYIMVTNDPLGARIYTLKNGLQVYLTVNKSEPRIQTFITVATGSCNDPRETTGLAHYMEHLMFKGTTKLGTSNWEKEAPLLEQISELYEQHKNAKTDEERKQIYKKIDSTSALAATYAVPSEYDKSVSSLGAGGTNAWTSNEQTVYINEIPSNELKRWLTLENERFSALVLRLFHTELETVYEEFNMSQDNDMRKAYFAMIAGLFPTHPYGVPVIGKGEHLKTPSMKNIHNYFSTYYVPNNMAICLSGDFDFEKTIKMIDETFGTLKSKDLPKNETPKEEPITKPVVKEVVGPESENVTLAFRLQGFNTDDRKYATLLNRILYNGTAGLIDIDLVQKQTLLEANCFTVFNIDYGYHSFKAKPRQGQKLEEAKDLLLAEIQKIKDGKFDEWMLSATVNNFKVSELRRQEDNYGRDLHFVTAFSNHTNWLDYVKFYDDIEKITKQELIDFTKKNYADNYVVVYKRVGIDSSVMKVQKPALTSVPMNRDAKSQFFADFEKIKSEKMEPVFVDFKKEIKTEDIAKGVDFNYLPNQLNELFTLYYVIEMGQNHDAKLPIAVKQLPYLGTDKYTPEQLQQEFYKLGVNLWVSSDYDRSYIYISGLKKSYEKAVELLEHLLTNVKPDQKSYDNYLAGVLKKRANLKQDKNEILWRAMFNFGKYGAKSPYTNILSEQELKQMNPAQLTDIIKSLTSYKHHILYYGQEDMAIAKSVITKYHKLPQSLKELPKEIELTPVENDKNRVYLIDYDMVQTQVLLVSKGQNSVKFTPEMMAVTDLFNQYFGSGLSSIVFQEIRESKALAYSAYASHVLPSKLNKPDFIYGFVATQSDKLKTATDALLGLLNNMPEAQIQFDASRDQILKRIESERITRTDIYFNYLENLNRGFTNDYRKDVYEETKTLDMKSLASFFDIVIKGIKGKNYTFLIIGKKSSLNKNTLSKLGEVKELTLTDVFNY